MSRKKAKKPNKKLAFRKQKKGIAPIVIAAALVVLFCGYMGYRSYELSQTKKSLEQDIESLQQKISDEEARTVELQEFEIYTHTKKYAEEVAKDVLGYVYEEEIVFKPDN